MSTPSPTLASAASALMQDAACINALPALWLPHGFRLLVLRQFHKQNEPPAFAWIGQRLLRTPERLSRHGLFFGNAFRPEIMTWLTERFGRPSVRENNKAHRNLYWPTVSWICEERLWPDDVRTTEWFVDVVFSDEESSNAFRERWRERLLGRYDADAVESASASSGPN